MKKLNFDLKRHIYVYISSSHKFFLSTCPCGGFVIIWAKIHLHAAICDFKKISGRETPGEPPLHNKGSRPRLTWPGRGRTESERWLQGLFVAFN
jgi:hypothetical protein